LLKIGIGEQASVLPSKFKELNVLPHTKTEDLLLAAKECRFPRQTSVTGEELSALTSIG
jgi:hypothetical protein